MLMFDTGFCDDLAVLAACSGSAFPLGGCSLIACFLSWETASRLLIVELHTWWTWLWTVNCCICQLKLKCIQMCTTHTRRSKYIIALIIQPSNDESCVVKYWLVFLSALDFTGQVLCDSRFFFLSTNYMKQTNENQECVNWSHNTFYDPDFILRAKSFFFLMTCRNMVIL